MWGMSRRSIANWILSHLSYTQIYVLICAFFFFSILPITLYWFNTHAERIQFIDDQLEELEIEAIFKNLFEQIQEHRWMMHQYIGNPYPLASIQTLNRQIQKTIDKAVEFDRVAITDKNNIFWRKINPKVVANDWKELIQNFPMISVEESDFLHKKILRNLLIQFGYLNARLGVNRLSHIENYTFLATIFLRLPYLQENMSELLLLASSTWDHLNEGPSHDRILALITLIESDISFLRYGIDSHQTDPQIMHGFQLLTAYLDSTEKYIQSIKKQTDSPDSLAIFQREGREATEKGNQLWNEGLSDLKQIFLSEKQYVQHELWIVPLTNFLLKVAAFFIGLALFMVGSRRLHQLTAATESFANGNLSIRVQDPYDDQIGHQAGAFNRMAQKLEEIIKHLYELLSATKMLSKGDLTARIPLRHDNTEFDEVAQSFNTMAETFETIIHRLQQIGAIVTTSAAEIASASTVQEKIVVDQENTTREIAIAANGISSSAKEFAKTMNEVGVIAEETSGLALKGKDSLHNMQAIMLQLVDASTTIAGKLAILNEKANNITTVITTITKVADQTNLLSLNASIEAEKAGEYGRSFSVIAREIRRLADQTAIATLDIERIINEIMTALSSSVAGVGDFTKEIRSGVEQVSNVSQQLGTIIEQVQIFTTQFELVNQGMQAQSTDAEQISTSITQLTESAAQTTQAIHHFHKTIQELNEAVNELRILIPFSNK